MNKKFKECTQLRNYKLYVHGQLQSKVFCTTVYVHTIGIVILLVSYSQLAS